MQHDRIRLHRDLSLSVRVDEIDMLCIGPVLPGMLFCIYFPDTLQSIVEVKHKLYVVIFMYELSKPMFCSEACSSRFYLHIRGYIFHHRLSGSWTILHFECQCEA